MLILPGLLAHQRGASEISRHFSGIFLSGEASAELGKSYSRVARTQEAFVASASPPSFFLLLLFFLLFFSFLLFLYLPPLSLFSSLSLLSLPLLLLALPPPSSFLSLSRFKSNEESQSIIQVEVELLTWIVEYRNLSLTSKVALE